MKNLSSGEVQAIIKEFTENDRSCQQMMEDWQRGVTRTNR